MLVKSLRFIWVLLALSWVMVSAAQDRAFIQAPLFEPAVDYEGFPRLENCVDERARTLKYHNCRDSRALYIAAYKKARAAGTPLMVIFGFNNCPYCTILEREYFSPEKPVYGGRIARYFAKGALDEYLAAQQAYSIPVLRLHARTEHGLKLADDLGVTKMAKDRGWHRVWSPFVVLINPQTGVMASESKWEAKEIYCDWIAGVATSLEKVALLEPGEPVTQRKRCPK